MAIRPTIRLINANWHDQTVVAFCSARCASHRGRKKRQRGRSPREAVGFPRFDGLIWKIGRVSEERRKKNARGKEMCMCIYIYICTFCSRSWASRTSAVWPTARIFSSRVSIRANQTSTSFLFASYRWLSPSIASNSVFLCIIFEFISSQCSLSFVTETTIGRTCRSQTFSSIPL